MPSLPPESSRHTSDPTDAGPATQKRWFNLNHIVIGLVVLVALNSLFSLFGSKRLALKEWAQKSATVASADYMNAGQLYADGARLFAAVGEPTVTRTTRAKLHLLWKCRDGRVEAVVDRHAFDFGKQLIGEISFYRD